MPYIKQEARAEIAGGRQPQNAGELVFKITRFCVNEIANEGPLTFSSIFRVVRDLTTLQHEIAQGVLQNTPSPLCVKIADELCAFKLLHADAVGPNDFLGILECVKLEFYRRVGVPHEDIKCEENGDCYQPFHGE